MPETPTDRFTSPFCRELRSKRWYFLEGPPREEEDILDGSNRVWCRRTMQSVGPDGELVDPAACRRGRGCYLPDPPEA